MACRSLALLVVFLACSLPAAVVAGELGTQATLQTFEDSFVLSLHGKLPADSRARDMVIIVDTSASQTGEFRTRTWEVLKELLASLDSRDRVQLLAADVEVAHMSATLTDPQGKEIQQAVQRLRERVPLGATDLVAALEAGARCFAHEPRERKRTILYLGDGMNIGGLVDNEQLRQLVNQLRSGRVSVTSFAVGPRLDVVMLAALANQTGGALAVDGQNLTAVEFGRQLAQATAVPVLWPQRLELPQELGQVYPRQLPPLRGDRDSVLLGKGQPAEALTVRFSGELYEEAITLNFEVAPVRNEDLSFLPHLVQRAQQDGGLLLPTIGTAGLQEAGRLVLAEAEQLGRLGRQALNLNQPQQAQLLAAGAQALDAANPTAHAVLRVAQAVEQPAPGPASEPDLRIAAPVGENLLVEFDRQRQILAARLQAEVSVAVRQAQRTMAADPQGVIDLLKLLQQNVIRAPELSTNQRSELREMISQALREADRQVTLHERASIQRQEQEAVRREQERVLEDIESKERRLTQLTARFSALMDEENYREAEEVSDLSRELDPTNPAIAAAGYNATMIDQIELTNRLRLARNRGMLATLATVEKAHIPTPDEPPIYYPPAEVWQALTERRKEYASVSLERHNAAEKKILAALEEPTILEFIETPLADVVAYLKDLHQIPIVLDRRALDDGGIGTDTPITQESLRGLSLKSALRIMLRDLDLTYIIDDEVLQITTVEEADSRLVTKVYPVADLVLPIQNLTGTGSGGLGLSGIGGGLGGGGFGGGGGLGGGGFGGGGQFGGGGGGFF